MIHRREIEPGFRHQTHRRIVQHVRFGCFGRENLSVNQLAQVTLNTGKVDVDGILDELIHRHFHQSADVPKFRHLPVREPIGRPHHVVDGLIEIQSQRIRWLRK